VYGNQGVHTDREVTSNRPDIIIKNKNEKTCILIDMAIPASRNVMQTSGTRDSCRELFKILKVLPL
jgi:hypothetical protein